MTRIKVCGITDERDAVEAAHLGVDAIGFVLSKSSPRYVAPSEAARIGSRLPPFVARVAVFKNDPPEVVADALYAAGVTAVQFDGPHAADYCSRHGISWYKGLEVRPDFTLEQLAQFGCTTYRLAPGAGWSEAPSGVAGALPGFWSLARAAAAYGRILLGGSITAETAGAAIAVAMPYAIEVSEAIEIVPGRPDIDRLEQFVEAVRAADAAKSFPR